MTIVKAQVRNRRIDVPAPTDIPDGAEVTLTIAKNDDNAPMPQEEIARILTAMQRMNPWTVPTDISSDLDGWEQKINQRGMDHLDPSAEDVFR